MLLYREFRCKISPCSKTIIIVTPIFCREQIVDACRTQRDYFEMAVNKAEKARECCDLVMLALYVYIPPSRGLEIRTMEIVRNWKDFHARDYKGRNVLVIKDIPEVSLHFDDHKTQKYTGHDELTLEVRSLFVMTFAS